MIFPLKISHEFRCWMSCQELQLNASLVKLIISLSSQLFLLGCLALLMTPSSVTRRLKMSHINFNFFFFWWGRRSISTSKCLLYWSHPFYACCQMVQVLLPIVFITGNLLIHWNDSSSWSATLILLLLSRSKIFHGSSLPIESSPNSKPTGIDLEPIYFVSSLLTTSL